MLMALTINLYATNPTKPDLISNKIITYVEKISTDVLNPSLSPLLLSDDEKFAYYLLFHPLLTLDKDWKWFCEICEDPYFLYRELSSSSGKDEIEINVQIKNGFHWGDGHSISAKDIILGWEVFRSSLNYKSWLSIEKHPSLKNTIIMQFDETNYPHERWGHIPIIPHHLENKIWKQQKKNIGNYLKFSNYTLNPHNEGLYNGAYTLESAKTNKLSFLKNKFHSPGSNYPSFFTIRKYSNSIADDKLAQTIFLQNSCDKQTQCSSLMHSEKTRKKLSLKKVWADQYKTEFLGLNLRNPIFANINMRRAIAFAINREDLIQEDDDCKLVPAFHLLHPKDPNYYSDFTFPLYDPQRAEDLLEAAGWKKKDTLRYKKEKALALTISYNKNSSLRQTNAHKICQNLYKIGIHCILQGVGPKEYQEKYLGQLKYSDLALFSITETVDSNYSYLLSNNEIPLVHNDYTGNNITAWRSYKLDEKLSILQATYSFNKRKSLIKDLMDLYLEEIPSIALFHYLKADMIGNQIYSYKTVGSQFSSSLFAKDWRLRKNIAKRSSKTQL